MTFEHAEALLIAAAAGGSVEGVEEWARIAKSSGIEINQATQLAGVLVSQGITDREYGTNALERISERIKGGGVKNPTGLLRTMLAQPGGPERSQKSIARERARVNGAAKFAKFVQTWDHRYARMAEELFEAYIREELGSEAASLLMPGGSFAIPLDHWIGMLTLGNQHWDQIRTIQLETIGAHA